MRSSIVGSIIILAVVSAAFAQDVASEPPSAGLKTATESEHVAMQQKGPKMGNPMDQLNRGWWSMRAAGWIGAIASCSP